MRRFFAHSISVARSPAGRNLNGAGQRVARSGGARAPSTAGSARPSSGAKWRSCRSAAEWNVEARTPRHAERREPRSQLARRLVGERDRHDLRRRERAGRDLLGDPPGDRRRLARARAARMQTGPRTASAARRCSGFRPSRRSTEPPYPRVRRSGCDVSATCLPAPPRGPSGTGSATIEPSLATTPSVSPSSTSRSSSASASSSHDGVDLRPGGAHDLRMRRRPTASPSFQSTSCTFSPARAPVKTIGMSSSCRPERRIICLARSRIRTGSPMSST